MLIYILYFFILSDCSELRSVFLVGFLAWFFEECAQRGFLIPIYSEEFSAMPDGRKHDRHKPNNRLENSLWSLVSSKMGVIVICKIWCSCRTVVIEIGFSSLVFLLPGTNLGLMKEPSAPVSIRNYRLCLFWSDNSMLGRLTFIRKLLKIQLFEALDWKFSSRQYYVLSR